ncbi:uncharacterized protein LOC117104933 [Anneissia japonica]|uniref:uncharacterized protein LOC117104933 n=1 Tax=Anneissia japonica TaxID=1529436 RepID=UPI001425B168|nr:uncharacterized protein LOC117104933 [Anneissia japonica]
MRTRSECIPCGTDLQSRNITPWVLVGIPSPKITMDKVQSSRQIDLQQIRLQGVSQIYEQEITRLKQELATMKQESSEISLKLQSAFRLHDRKEAIFRKQEAQLKAFQHENKMLQNENNHLRKELKQSRNLRQPMARLTLQLAIKNKFLREKINETYAFYGKKNVMNAAEKISLEANLRKSESKRKSLLLKTFTMLGKAVVLKNQSSSRINVLKMRCNIYRDQIKFKNYMDRMVSSASTQIISGPTEFVPAAAKIQNEHIRRPTYKKIFQRSIHTATEPEHSTIPPQTTRRKPETLHYNIVHNAAKQETAGQNNIQRSYSVPQVHPFALLQLPRTRRH